MRSLAIVVHQGMRACFLPILLVAACDVPPTAAQPQALDLTLQWAMCDIVPGVSAGANRGADGTDALYVDSGFRIVRGAPGPDDHLLITSPMEEGNTVAIREQTAYAANTCGTWDPVISLAVSQLGAEDSKFGDFDGDGIVDLALIGRNKIYIAFGNSNHTFGAPVMLTVTQNHAYWLQAAVVDLDGDGNTDLVAGSYGSSSAVLALIKNPGGGAKRDGTAWTYTMIRAEGRPMTIDCSTDIDSDTRPDCFETDRDGAGSPKNWRLWSASFVRNPFGDPPPQIYAEYGACGPTGSGCSALHLGDAMMGAIYDWDGDGHPDFFQGYSHVTDATNNGLNHIAIYNGANPTQSAAWTATYIPESAINTNTGHVQAVAVLTPDTVCASMWELNTPQEGDSTKSGVICAVRQPDGSYARWEVSGPLGTKFDNLTVVDLDRNGHPDLVTSEQNYDARRVGQPDPNGPAGGMGVVGYLNPTPDPEIDGAPDAGVDAAPDAMPDACGGVH